MFYSKLNIQSDSTFTSATPAPSIGNNVWKLGDLALG